MVSFESDYNTGAHPKILQRFAETNLEPVAGYGLDVYCLQAKEKIRAACECPEAEVEFLTGGTQANAIVISTMLKDYQGVVAAQTGHISAHEAGSIEYTGHEVLTLPQQQGKVSAADLKEFLETFYADENREHLVYPGMLYISHPTEYGTLYTKQELSELSQLCHTYDMSLFMDGARLSYGLMSKNTDVTLADIARLCDVFYIGGTKVGALCGEAVVFTKNNRPAHFMNSVKKRGALIAKGRLLGVQFDTLFTDDLYFEIGRHAIEMAEKMKRIFEENKMQFFMESFTNQQFIVLENSQMEELRKQVAFGFWEKFDDTHTVVRFATGWSTTDADLEVLRRALA